MQKFEIVLKNEKLQAYHLIALLIVVSHCLLFIFLLFNEKYFADGAAGIIILILYFIYRWIISRVKKVKLSFDDKIYFVLIIFWIQFHIYWMAGICAVLMLLQVGAVSTISFQFSKDKIAQKNLPWKEYDWSELDNVILKDNMLTLDLKNNRLLQASIENTGINEYDFNEFAKQQLKKS